jgi:hypothetical protein
MAATEIEMKPQRQVLAGSILNESSGKRLPITKLSF